MPAALALLIAAAFGPALLADAARAAPSYTAASVVNAADSQPGPLAPNTIATIYGQGLSYVTKSLSTADINGGVLPLGLPGTGVNVNVGSIAATIFYVSPTQINFLIPSILLPGPSHVQVVLNGIAGPSIPVQLAATSPALFQLDAQTVIATRLDGTVATSDAPSHGGDILTLYATGLGDTVPPIVDRQVPNTAERLQAVKDFRMLLDGIQVDPRLVLYAGVAPGFAGLYQINVMIPTNVGPNPEVQIGFASTMSPPGLRLPLTVE